VNKMDIVDYSEETFAAIRAEFVAFASQLGLKSVTAIPVSALEGDNVVSPSTVMTWYDGPTLLEFLETVPLRNHEQSGPLRFPVQLVLRPDANFRGFAGQVARGVLRSGQRVMALPSRRETTVSRIVTWDGDLTSATYPQSVTVELADEIDLSRGEMLVAAQEDSLPASSRLLRAMVVWMNEDPLVVGRTYLAKHTTRTVRATVRSIRYRVDVRTLEHAAASQLAMNEIAEVELETNLPLFFDAYADSRTTGSLILIDGISNATVGAAMITGAVDTLDTEDDTLPSLIHVPDQPELAERLRATIVARGHHAVVIDDVLIPDSSLLAVVRALSLARVTAITARTLPANVEEDIVRAIGKFSASGVLRGESINDKQILSILGDK